MQRSYLYTGRMNSGLTLSSIIHIVLFNKINPKYNIVSNIHLKELPHEMLDKEKLLEYHDSIILYDGSFSLPSNTRIEFSSIPQAREIAYFIKFLNKLEENNNIFITNTSRPEYIFPEIRNELYKIDTLYNICNYDRENNSLKVTSNKYSTVIKNVDTFFKYYDTMEIPKDLVKELMKENK